jgi:hypothetical protein
MKLKYSHSKRDVLSRCMRRYYYEYYASSLRPSSDTGSLFDVFDALPKPKVDSARIAFIRKLRALTSCPLAAGDILHQLIATYLRKNPDWGVDWFIKKAGERFDRIVNYSRDPVGNRQMLEQDPNLGALLEFYYGTSDAEQRAMQARENLIGAIHCFFNVASISDLCHRIPADTRLVETPISGIIVDDCSVGGKVDLAGYTDGCVNVVDWKIGRPSGCHESLQLITYGWWASRHFRVSPASVCVRRVFLGDGTIEDACILNKSLIERAETRIIQDIELMKDLHTYGQIGNEEAFTPCGKVNVCRNCKYQELCLDGYSATSSRRISDSSLARAQIA